VKENTEPPRFDSLDLEPEAFRRLGYRVVDMLTDYYATLRERPVTLQNPSEAVGLAFREPLPQVGQEPDTILNEWSQKVLPNATHIGSPRFFGFVNGSGTMLSTLAEALASSVNMNLGAWKASPAATEIERLAISWIAQLIGYPESCGGMFLGGGTLANFAALLTALRNQAGYDTTAEGLQSLQRTGKYTVYMADHEGHISVVRAVDMLNLGRQAIRRVPSKDDFTLDPEALERMLEEDSANGCLPLCVVAQVGSINVGVIDPLEAIARICSDRGIWFHADGACGAFGAMLPELKARYAGLERADSVTLDPHKWLYIPYECGCVLVREPEKLRRTFSIAAPYLRGTLPTEYSSIDFFEYGPQMSRGFNALKVWMTLKQYGVEGYQKLLRQNLLCTRRMYELVEGSDGFESMHSPQLFIYSFRYCPKDLKQSSGADADAYLDRLNQLIADEITASGLAFIMTTRIRGRVVLRISVCSHRTTLQDIEQVFAALGSIAQKLDRQERPLHAAAAATGSGP
jgi:aromatic-L-amino-acid/L-tryptophan decarboxylase